jgi:hypothetical protein
MSYLFPKRALRAGDVLDPTDLTEDIAPAAERVSGRLNAHNISETISSSVGVDEEAYYAIYHYVRSAGFIWSTATPGSLGVPDAGGTESSFASPIQNNFEWQSLDNATYGTVRVSPITGMSVLWINAYAQYLWYGFDRTAYGPTWWSAAPGSRDPGQHRNGAMTRPCGLQFALRVDGNIIPETITGIDDTTYRASTPIKPTSQRVDTVLLTPGPADIRGEQICSLGPPCLPIRVGACVPVSPGDHVVELVVRRVPFVFSRARGAVESGGTAAYGGYDNLYVFARQLNVIELKAHPVDSVAAFEVSAPSFIEEEVLSTAAVYTDRVQPVVAAYNAVGEGALQRGALAHYHLPSALLGAATTERSYAGSGPVFNNWIPSTELLDTVTLTGYAGTPGVGWKLIDDSGVDPISVTNFDVQSQCKVLVLVNMQVRNIKGGSEVSSRGNSEVRTGAIDQFALFKIMYQLTTATSTDWVGVNESIGMVNDFVWWPKTPPSGSADPLAEPAADEYGLEHVEIQLMALLTFNGFSLNRRINIGVFGGVANNGCTYQVGRGNIIALKLRAP